MRDRWIVALIVYFIFANVGDNILDMMGIGLGDAYGISYLSGKVNISFSGAFASCILAVISATMLLLIDEDNMAFGLAGLYWLYQLWSDFGNRPQSNGMAEWIGGWIGYFLITLENIIMLAGLFSVYFARETIREMASSWSPESKKRIAGVLAFIMFLGGVLYFINGGKDTTQTHTTSATENRQQPQPQSEQSQNNQQANAPASKPPVNTFNSSTTPANSISQQSQPQNHGTMEMPPQSRHNTVSDVTLGNISIGDSFGTVKQILGTPDKEELKENGKKYYFYPSGGFCKTLKSRNTRFF